MPTYMNNLMGICIQPCPVTNMYIHPCHVIDRSVCTCVCMPKPCLTTCSYSLTLTAHILP